MHLQVTDINELISANLRQISITAPKCGVDVQTFTYNTIDPLGEPATATEAVMVPTVCRCGSYDS
jgi:hypothetical protein